MQKKTDKTASQQNEITLINLNTCMQSQLTQAESKLREADVSKAVEILKQSVIQYETTVYMKKSVFTPSSQGWIDTNETLKATLLLLRDTAIQTLTELKTYLQEQLDIAKTSMNLRDFKGAFDSLQRALAHYYEQDSQATFIFKHEQKQLIEIDCKPLIQIRNEIDALMQTLNQDNQSCTRRLLKAANRSDELKEKSHSRFELIKAKRKDRLASLQDLDAPLQTEVSRRKTFIEKSNLRHVEATQRIESIQRAKENSPLVIDDAEITQQEMNTRKDILEEQYKLALKKCQSLRKKYPEMKPMLNEFFRAVKILKTEEIDQKYTHDLILALDSTRLRMEGKMDSEEFMKIAQTMHGRPSTSLKILGGMLAILGIAIAVLSIIFAPAIFGFLAATMAFTFAAGTAGALVGGATAVTASLTLGGATLFALNCQRGLSLSMSDMDEYLEKNKDVPVATP